MAGNARRRRRGHVRSRQSKPGQAVIETCGRPTYCAVAYRTIRCRKLRTRRRVYRIIRLLPGRQMASRIPAIVRRSRQSIVVIGVAGSARHGGMPIGQRKPGGAVVEYRRRPTYCAMAYRAVRCRKLRTRRRVHRIIRLLPGRQMASRIPAISRRGRQVVVVIDVARCASHVGMPIGQQKPGRAVVECRRRPTDRGMARRAIGKAKSRPGRWMHRIRGLPPRRQMASRVSAIGRRNHQVIVVINVAGSARHVGMPIRQ